MGELTSNSYRSARRSNAVNSKDRLEAATGAELDTFTGLVTKITTGLTNQLVTGVGITRAKSNTAVIRTVNDATKRTGIEVSGTSGVVDRAGRGIDDNKREGV